MYRIGINGKVGGQVVSFRYASDEEYVTLRVNRKGVVERLVEHRDAHGRSTFAWVDVSNTHIAEMGMITRDGYGDDLPIYHGDIYIDLNTGYRGMFMYPDSWAYLSPIQPFEAVRIEIVSNVHSEPDWDKPEQPLSDADKSRMGKVYENWKHESGVI